MKKLLAFLLLFPSVAFANVLIDQPNGQWAIISSTNSGGVETLNVSPASAGDAKNILIPQPNGSFIQLCGVEQADGSTALCTSGSGGGGAVTSVSGTAGQITVSPTTGDSIVSLPATITSDETFSGIVNMSGTFQIGGTALAIPITNAKLQNPSTTVNGQTCTLGGSCTVTAAPGTLTGSHIFVGSAGNVATDVAMSGDVGIANTGLTTIQPGVVSNTKLANSSTTVNGQTCTLGSSCTVTTAASSVATGTTTVTGGTNGRILFNNSGVLGEKTVTGSGNAVLATSPSVSDLTVTGSFTAAGLVGNAALANPSVTVNGTSCTLGSSCVPGGLVKISTQTASAGASIAFTGLSTYNTYKLECQGVFPATNATTLLFQTGQGGTPTWNTSGYKWFSMGGNSSATTVSGSNSASGTGIELANGNTNTDAASLSFNLTLTSATSTTRTKAVTAMTSELDSNAYFRNVGGTYTTDTNAITAMRIIAASGNITGTCTLDAVVP